MHNIKTGRSLVCLLIVKPRFRSLKLLNLYKTDTLHVCLCTKCVPGSYAGQNWVLNLLELQVQMVVSHFVGTRR